MAVDVGEALDMALIIDPQCEIGQMHGEAVVQLDGLFAFADQSLQLGLVIAHRAQQHIGQSEGLVNPDATMAEGTLFARKQITLGRIMQINGVLVREHEFDETQSIAFTGRLSDAHNPLVFIADHLIAMPFGIIGIRGKFG